MTSGPAAALVHTRLQVHGHTVAVAESLTGGLLAAALTDTPGASTTVRGGVVAYVDEVKSQLLGVPASLLAEHGAVSRRCAEAMAHGVRELLGADWGVSTTGVAGPGPSEGKQVGTVHVAVAGEHHGDHRALHLHGTRAQIRGASVTAGLELLLDVLDTQLSGGRGTVEDHPRDTGAENDEEG